MLTIPGYSMLSTTSTTLVFGMVFLFLAFQYNRDYMRHWGLCWAVYALMFFLDFINIIGLHEGPAYPMLRQILSLSGSVLFLNGTHTFFRVKAPRWFSYFMAISLVLIGLSHLFRQVYDIVVIPNALYCSFLLIWSGCMFIVRFWTQNVPEKSVAGFLIILWAVFLNYFGFTPAHVTLAVINYFAGVFIVNLLIIFLLIIHFKKVRFMMVKNEERFRLLVENSSDCMFLYNYGTRRFQYVSPVVSSMTGISAEDLYLYPERFFDKIVVSENAEGAVGIFRNPIDSPAGATFFLAEEGGPVKWSEMHYLPIVDAAGAVGAVEGIIRDITERRATEESLRASESAKRELIENISHELRTPITLIQGYTESLLDDVIPPVSKRNYLKMIHSKIGILNALLEDLVRTPQVASQTMNFKFYETDARSYFEAVIDQAEFQVKQSGGRFVRDNEIDADSIVILDSGRIEQVVLNLIDNAIRHTPPGGTISVACAGGASREKPPGEAVVEADPLSIPAGEIVFSVADSGRGFHPDDLPRVFERNYRGRGGTQTHADKKGSGLGLGLAISAQIIRQHSGRIWASNREAGGARISFTLPYYKNHAP
jgi:PAS domain S-box-containing protein